MSAPTIAEDIASRLLAHASELGAQSSAAVAVLRCADDLNATGAQLAAAVTADATLSAKTIKLANSAYFGVAGRVSNVLRAVTVIGFSQVRALAAYAAAGINGDDGAWDGFSSRSALLASASSDLAARFHVRASDALSAGLLSELGAAVLNRIDPNVAAGARAAANRCEAEQAAFGVSHAQAGQLILARWNFPAVLTAAIGEHHDPTTPLAQVLHAAELLIDGSWDQLASMYQISEREAVETAARVAEQAGSVAASML